MAIEIQAFFDNKVAFSDIGGVLVKMINDTGSPSVYGELVEASTAIDFGFKITDADNNHPIGVVAESGIADGEATWIVIYGCAEILLQDETISTHGYWVRTSVTTGGRVDITNAGPPGGGVINLDIHMQEVGHCLESKGSGTDVLARCTIHFN